MISLRLIRAGLVISFATLATACSHHPINGQTEDTSNTLEKIIPAPIHGISEESLKKTGEGQEIKKRGRDNNNISENIKLWQKVREGFVIVQAFDLPVRPRVQKELNKLLNKPDYLKFISRRAQPYLYHIVGEIEKRNMPMEIALLAAIESAYKAKAYSRVGAAGVWQFMPATGRLYGLEQNWWYDGRRDIVASTRAALDYLERLYGYFGDWHLAFAAYNAGEGKVGRAIKRNRRANKGTDYWSLSLPRETMAYVPKILALSYVILQPEYYGLFLPEIENKAVFRPVKIDAQIALERAAKMAGTSLNRFKQFNAGFKRWVTAPDGPDYLILPIENIVSFQRKFASLSPEERQQWQRHRVKRGESLSLIASRYGTTVKALKRANKLKSNRILIGQQLIIPLETHFYAAKKSKTRSTKKGKKARSVIHTVKKGETWWELAIAYQVNIRQLAKWNGKRTSDTLRIGQKLTILQPGSIMKKNKKVEYRVRRGDALWRIARRFNVSLAKLKKWNHLSNASLLHPGQIITLYLPR